MVVVAELLSSSIARTIASRPRPRSIIAHQSETREIREEIVEVWRNGLGFRSKARCERGKQQIAVALTVDQRPRLRGGPGERKKLAGIDVHEDDFAI